MSSRRASIGNGWWRLARRGQYTGIGVGRGVDALAAGRRCGRARRRTARRRRRQRLAVGIAARSGRAAVRPGAASLVAGIAGDGVRDGQARLAALTGARVRHRQRGRAWLSGLRVGALGRRQHVRVQAEIGERGVDERLEELAGKQIGDVGLEERSRGENDSPSDMAYW